jgi:lipoprotein-releasing system permease protein
VRLVLFIALRQLWARKLLNGIAVGGVTLGVAALVAMYAIVQGLEKKFEGEILRISPHVTLYDEELSDGRGILARFFGDRALAKNVAHEQPSDRVTRIQRPNELLAQLEDMREVEAACASLVGHALISRGSKDLGVEMRGIQPLTQERCTPMGGYVRRGEWRALAITGDGISLGDGVADKLGAQVGDRVRLLVPGGAPRSLQVTSIWSTGIPPIDKGRIYVTLATAQQVLKRPEVIGRLEVRLRDPWRAPAFAQRLKTITGNDAESWQEQNANMISTFAMMDAIISMVIAAILVVGGFGILSVQIMIVLQKTRDIAILRSVGLRKRDILLNFLVQGVVISLVGALAGDFIGWQIVETLGNWKVHAEGLVSTDTFLVYKNPGIYWWGSAFAMVVGVGASLLPAWRAHQLEPVEVLRGQIG